MREAVAAKIHNIAEVIHPQAQLPAPEDRDVLREAIETIQNGYDRSMRDLDLALENRRIRGLMLEEAVLKYKSAVSQRSSRLISLLDADTADIDELMDHIQRLSGRADEDQR